MAVSCWFIPSHSGSHFCALVEKVPGVANRSKLYIEGTWLNSEPVLADVPGDPFIPGWWVYSEICRLYHVHIWRGNKIPFNKVLQELWQSLSWDLPYPFGEELPEYLHWSSQCPLPLPYLRRRCGTIYRLMLLMSEMWNIEIFYISDISNIRVQ